MSVPHRAAEKRSWQASSGNVSPFGNLTDVRTVSKNGQIKRDRLTLRLQRTTLNSIWRPSSLNATSTSLFFDVWPIDAKFEDAECQDQDSVRGPGTRTRLELHAAVRWRAA